MHLTTPYLGHGHHVFTDRYYTSLPLAQSLHHSQSGTAIKNRADLPVIKPVVIDKYNQNMNGVDLGDQYAVYYNFVRKTVKWWRKLVFWLLETSVVNSYILYKETMPNPKSHVAFRRSLSELLVKRHQKLVLGGIDRDIDEELLLFTLHSLEGGVLLPDSRCAKPWAHRGAVGKGFTVGDGYSG